MRMIIGYVYFNYVYVCIEYIEYENSALLNIQKISK